MLDEPARDLREVRGRLAADADVLAPAPAGLDGELHEAQHGRVALVEALEQARVAVHAEGELREVVGADGVAVEVLEKGVGEHGVRGDLAHLVDAQPALAALEAVARHELEHAPALLGRAHEGDHDGHVVQPHDLAHVAQGLALEGEALGEPRREVAEGAAEADHGVLLARLEALAADEARVLVGLEVRGAHDHGPRIEGGGDGADTFGEAQHVEGARVGVARGARLYARAGLGVERVGLEQRARVHADGVVDDELEPRQPDAGRGQGRELEGDVRVADVEHERRARARQLRHVDTLHAEGQAPVVDVAGVALGAAHGHLASRADRLCGVAGADHGGDAQLARDDGGVAGAPAAVGDDGRRALHHRLPVGVGDVRDQHLPLLELVHVRGLEDDARAAGGDALAHAAPGDQHGPAPLQAVDLLHARVGARLHGLGPRLHHVQAPVAPVLGPFDVHRHGAAGALAVVALDDHAPARQLQHLVVVDAEAALLLGAHAHVARGDARGGVGAVDQLELLAPELALEDGAEALLQGGLEDVELVGVHLALDDVLAQAPGGGDEHHVAEAGLGVEREQDAARGEVGAHHLLHAHRERHRHVVEAVVDAIGDGAVGEERGEDAPAGIQQGARAADVEIGLLLAGEGGRGQVLGRGGAAHGDVGIRAELGLELGVGARDLVGEVRRELPVGDPVADARAGARERLDVGDVQARQRLADALHEAVVLEVVAVALGGDGEAVRHAHPLRRELAVHLAERGVLAADEGDVLHADLGEASYVAVALHGFLLRGARHVRAVR